MTKLLSTTLIMTSMLSASTLQEDALSAGLSSIPSSKTELFKLIDNPNNHITHKKIQLGKKLYFDPRLSKSGFISCNSCHNLSEGGDDGLEAAVGHKWTINPHHLNSPTVYNSVFNDKQFWDGRSPHLEDQAQGPIQAGPEMAATKEHVENTINSMPEYVEEFKSAYGKNVEINFTKITDTIGLFERTLVTPSAFDKFLQGDTNALSSKQQEGLKTFIKVGCATCHNGIGIGGGMNAFNIAATYKYMDIGDFKGDKNSMVKVPTLRNITQTAPYFHNGKIWSLKEAIIEMARIQLGTFISDEDTMLIEEFLKSLDGTKASMKMPILPASTSLTPKPDLN